MDPSSGIPQVQQMSSQSVEKKPRPHPEQALKCPRCNSTSTKFCYYNNYSLSQPRYFCKSCRRYWTKGGTLRNVPVGGGCRKKRSSSTSKRAQDQTFTPNRNPLTTLPPLSYDSSDFTLALARFQKQSSGQLVYNDHDLSILGNPTGSFCDILGNSGMNPTSADPSFLDAIRTGFLETQNHLQNLFFVCRNDDMREVDNSYTGGVGVREEMMLPYDQVMSNAANQSVSVTAMKQELCSGKEHRERRVMGGFPWQLNADTNIGEFDSGRAIASWNSLTSSWHGLLDSQ